MSAEEMTMNIYEFQAKELLARRRLSIPDGRVAASADEAEKVAREMAHDRYVVKAQVHAGDRLAGGGVRFVNSPAEARTAAAAMLDSRLATRQTGPRGELIRWVYIEEAVTSPTQIYVAAAVDRAAGEIVMLGSSSVVDDSDPHAVMDRGELERLPVRIVDDHAMADFAGLARRILPAGANVEMLAELLQLLANTLIELDATLIEINPLALTADGRFIALDTKMTVDDNALFRHPDLANLHQAEEGVDRDPTELMADRRQINYVAMDGNIGVVVNGAGLALATLDCLIDAGGRPANFMDVRTTATSLDFAFAFGLVLANPKVRAIFLNVHGGGMQRCDTIVEGMAVAMRRNDRVLPLTVRLAGNNADFARNRLKTFGINFVEGSTIADAAQLAARMVSKEVA
jgi:succinyl-CoA synthetase beta subunit